VVLIPDKEQWTLQFDNRKWEQVTLEDEPNRSDAPAPGTIQLRMDLFMPMFGGVRGPAPPLEQFIEKEETAVEPSGDMQP
jgi:hypothetical protein